MDTGDVATAAVDAFNVPNCLAGTGIVIGEKASAVLLGKSARETPLVAVEGAEVEKLDTQQVALCVCSRREQRRVMRFIFMVVDEFIRRTER